MENTNIIISNIKDDKKYKGAYASIFRILNYDSIFIERYETNESIGYKKGQYFLQIKGIINANEYESILKIKNVIIK